MDMTNTKGRPSEKQEALLKAAFELFCQKGYKHVTTAEIARMAEVSVGTLYKYYPNKKAVILAAYDLWNEDIMNNLREIWDHFGKPFALREYIEFSLDSVVKDHLFSKKAHDEIWAMIYSDEDFRRLYNQRMLRSVDIIVSTLGKFGFSVPNIRERTHFVNNMVEIYAHEVAYRETEGLEYERIRDTLIEFICDLFLK